MSNNLKSKFYCKSTPYNRIGAFDYCIGGKNNKESVFKKVI